MRVPMRAALLTASAGLLVGFACGATIYGFLLRPDLPFSASLVSGVVLGGATAVFGFAVVFIFVHWRLANSMPPMGSWWGASLSVVVVALVTLIHALVAAGADGWVLSFIGQFFFAMVLVGWLAILLGVALGRHINRAAV